MAGQNTHRWAWYSVAGLLVGGVVLLGFALRRGSSASIGGFKVRFVDGERLRRDHTEFTMGCHWLVDDCKYIPEGEIWIDKRMSRIDREATVVHELVEINRMLKGENYDQAHAAANVSEQAFRRMIAGEDTSMRRN